MHDVRLYFRYLGVSVRSQMQYRGSFIMLTLGQFVVTGSEFLGVLALFHRFEQIKGWRLPEVGLFYGLIMVAFACADALGRGFDVFPAMVKGGDFDRVLLRPRSAALQVGARELTTFRVGRLAQGMLVLLWSASVLGVEWSVAKVGLAVFAVLGGTCLFVGLFVLQATLAFWTTETLEIMNALTYGGCETAQYPLSVYRDWFRKFFTFVVPLACVTYFPALAILGRVDTAAGSPVWFQCAAPSIGVLFLIVSLQVWRVGVRHYRSTGS